MASATNFDPYHKWLGIPPDEQPPNHYRLLGIKPLESDADVIQSAADQRMSHLRTFQTGAHAEFSQRLLNELAAARVCLLKPERKQAYDDALKKKLTAGPPAPPPNAGNSGVLPKAARVAVPVAAAAIKPVPVAAAVPPKVQVAASPGEIEFSVEAPTSSRKGRAKKSDYTLAYLAIAVVGVAALSAGGVWLMVGGKRPAAVASNPRKSPGSVDASKNDNSNPPKPSKPADTQPPDPKKPEPPEPEPKPPVAETEPPEPDDPPSVPLRRMPASIDDGDTSGFKLTGNGWKQEKNEGVSYKGTHFYQKVADGSASATWTFDGLEPGKPYQVFATWHGHRSHASNSPFLVMGISGQGTSVINVDQREAARADARFNGHPFQRLGVFTCASGTLTVQLSNAADNYVVADAVLLVPAKPEDVAAVPTPRPQKPLLPETPEDANTPAISRADDPTLLAKFQRPVTGVSLVADASQAVVSTLDPRNPASVWDLKGRSEQRRIENHRQPYLCLAAVPGQQLFFLGTEQGTLVLWDLRDETRIQAFPLFPRIGPITAIAPLADGKTVAIGGRDRVALVSYTLQAEDRSANSRNLVEWPGFTSAVTALAMSPDGRRIIAGCGGAWAGNEPRASDDMQIHGYDVPTKDTKDFTGHHGSVWCMAISEDGTRLVTGSSDGKVRLWDTAKAKLIEEMPGHDGAVLAVEISADGATIVSGGQDGSVRVWEARTGRAVRELAGHRAPVRAVAYDPRSKQIVSGSQDGELRLFDLNAADSVVAEVAEKREPTPSQEARVAALKLVQEVFADDLSAAKTPSEKLELADKFLAQAAKSKDLAERFVLVDEARKLALSAGDISRVLSTIRDQAERFEIDRWADEIAAFDELSKSSTTNAVRRQLAEAALEQVDRALVDDQYEAAKKVLVSALTAAKKANDALLVKQVTARGKEVVELAKAYEAIAAATETLKLKPEDPAAHDTLGKHHCFVRQNWKEGLPHLVKGSDAGLAEVARLEDALPDDAEKQTALADRWWDLAAAAEGLTRTAMLTRAEYWYREALPQLSGLSETKVNKRIEEVTAQLEKQESSAGSGKLESSSSLARSLGMKIRAAIKANNLTRTPLYGRNFRAQVMNDLPPGGLLLTGFNYSVIGGQQVVSLQPIYAGAKGPLPGNVYGDPTQGAIGKVEAPKGYAVGGLEVYGEGRLAGFTVIFMKITRTGLDPKDTKRSNTIGWMGGEGSVTSTLGGDGQPVVGILAALRRNELDGFGLIQVGK